MSGVEFPVKKRGLRILFSLKEEEKSWTQRGPFWRVRDGSVKAHLTARMDVVDAESAASLLHVTRQDRTLSNPTGRAVEVAEWKAFWKHRGPHKRETMVSFLSL